MFSGKINMDQIRNAWKKNWAKSTGIVVTGSHLKEWVNDYSELNEYIYIDGCIFAAIKCDFHAVDKI